MGLEARCVWSAGAILGEGPLWVENEAALYWVDIKAPAVHRYDPENGAKHSWPMPEPIGCLARRASGGFVAGLKSGFAFFNSGFDTIARFDGPETDSPGNRTNDGKTDSQGRLWAGTMDDAEIKPTGALYCLEAGKNWRRMDSGYVITNGPAFSPDGKTLYHTDTLKRVIFAFDLAADGAISNKREFVKISEQNGYPDGMTIDAEGGLWVAHFGGFRVTRYDHKGNKVIDVKLPVANITSCAFGGADLDRLYITTATKGLDGAARAGQPLAGGLFSVETGVRGLPMPAYAG
jgi:sugar lactone lactonase YvrE